MIDDASRHAARPAWAGRGDGEGVRGGSSGREEGGVVEDRYQGQREQGKLGQRTVSLPDQRVRASRRCSEASSAGTVTLAATVNRWDRNISSSLPDRTLYRKRGETRKRAGEEDRRRDGVLSGCNGLLPMARKFTPVLWLRLRLPEQRPEQRPQQLEGVHI